MPPSPAFIPASLLLEDIGVWPADVAELDGGTSALDRIGVREVGIAETATQTTAHFALVFADELKLSIPGLSGVDIVFGGTGVDSEFKFELDLRQPMAVRLVDVTFALRFAPTMLRSVRKVGERFEVDPTNPPVEIATKATFIVDESGLRVEGLDEVTLTPCMIGNSGVVIEAPSVRLDLSQTSSLAQAQAAGLPPSWMGVFIEYAAIHLPPELGTAVPSGLSFHNAFIGTGGFTGEVAASWDPGFGGAIGDFEFFLRRFALEFRQNSLVRSEIVGTLTVPFVEEPIDVDVGLTSDGRLTARLSDPTGIVELRKPGVLTLRVNAISFEIADGLFVVQVRGAATPELLGDGAPTFEVRELAIDSRGHVHLEGGWLDLRERYVVDLHGFQLEISKLGFGSTADGGKWIGFTGGIKLVEGLPAGASAEGLRVTWYEDGRPPRLTLDGVGVELAVPDVLRFKGAVSYDAGANRFTGAVRLDLIALGIQIDGRLVVAPDHFAVYVAAELPAGIPLFSTGLALYGMAGLFASHMAPARAPGDAWYETPDGQPGWYKRPPVGISDVTTKWARSPGSLAFGAGVTIGTVADNGFTFSGKTLLVILFPGPVLLIEGKANLLRERATLDGEPLFRALAVLDGRAGNLLVGLDAHYRQADQGELIEIRGSAEAYFDFHRPDRWHLYLGQNEPRERRIRASLFQLFESRSYVMLDAGKLAMGAWIGYEGEWTFGPLGLALEAWMDANAVVSIRPAHFHGDLWLHGKIQASAFGLGLGLEADARFSADVFEPFHVKGDIAVKVDLPWPFSDFDVVVGIEWGPNPVPPALAPPLQEIAVEHFKSTSSWPLPRAAADGRPPLLIPARLDTNGDGIADTPAPAEEVAALGAAPVVPLDARPHVTFARPVHDRALAGVNGQGVLPAWERVGDPARNEGPVAVRYGLERIELQKRAGGGWVTVARTRAAAGQAQLYGSWAPVPRLPSLGGESVGQVKLWLWSRTPFDYTRHAGRGWDDWFEGQFPSYPCVGETEPPAPLCCTMDALDEFAVRTGSVSYVVGSEADPFGDGYVIYWRFKSETGAYPLGRMIRLAEPVDGAVRMLAIPARVGSRAVEVVMRLLWMPSPRAQAIARVRLARPIPFDATALVHTSHNTETTVRVSGYGDVVELRYDGSAFWMELVTIAYDFNSPYATTPPRDIEIVSVTTIRDGGPPRHWTTDTANVPAYDAWSCPGHPVFTYRNTRDQGPPEWGTPPLVTLAHVVSAPGRVAGFTDALRIHAAMIIFT